MIALKTKLN